ncbi:MAG: WG repeat-containing protein [Syntrophomonadaceae bacterium]
MNKKSFISMVLMILVVFSGYYLSKPWLESRTAETQSPFTGVVKEEAPASNSGDSKLVAEQPQSPSKPSLVPFQENGLWGYKDGGSGDIKAAPQFKSADNYREGRALVQMLDNRFAYLDEAGQIAVQPFDAAYAMAFSEGLAARGDRKVGQYVDAGGQVVMALECKVNHSFKYGLARVALADDQWGFIDKAGRWAIYPSFQYVSEFSEGLAAARINGKFGFIFTNGNWAFEPQYDSASIFSYGLAAVAKDGKWGYVDKTGYLAIPLKFDVARDFNYYGLAEVLIGKEWYHIDRNGNIIDKFLIQD